MFSSPQSRDGADVLIVDLLPYEQSTRSKKIAESFSSRGLKVEFVGLARVGRLGIEGRTGSFSAEGVHVVHVDPGRLIQGSTWSGSFRNLLRNYIPAIVAMGVRSLGTPAGTVVVGHTALAGIGFVHNKVYGSRLVLNARERLGGVRTKGSLATLVSAVEPLFLRWLARDPSVVVLSVAEGHAEEYQRLGRWQVHTVRNVPRRGFGGEFRGVPELPPLKLCLLGSLYPGRGVLAAIEAVGLCKEHGVPVVMDLVGRWDPGLLTEARVLIDSLNIVEEVVLRGPCLPHEVVEWYKQCHVGLALYEASDAANDSLSNKIFEVAAAGRPVLAGNLPENTRLVATLGIGWTAPVTGFGLFSAILRVWEDRGSIPELAAWVYEVASQEFVWEREVALVLDNVPE